MEGCRHIDRLVFPDGDRKVWLSLSDRRDSVRAGELGDPMPIVGEFEPYMSNSPPMEKVDWVFAP